MYKSKIQKIQRDRQPKTLKDVASFSNILEQCDWSRGEDQISKNISAVGTNSRRDNRYSHIAGKFLVIQEPCNSKNKVEISKGNNHG